MIPEQGLAGQGLAGGQRLGLLLRVKHAVIEGNVFDRNGSAAVALENHPWWNPPEGLASEDVLIVNNELRHIPATHFGTLFAAIMKGDNALATGPRMLQRIRVIANDFVDWREHAIHFNHGLDAELRCNRFTADPVTPVGSSASAIHVNDSTSVRILDNRIDDPRAGVTPVTVNASDGVTEERNGPTASTAVCPVAPARPRGASSAPVWR